MKNRKITWKDVLIVLLDIIAVNGSYLLALFARFYGFTKIGDVFYSYLDAFWHFVPFYTVICLFVFWRFKLYNGMWRFAGMNDINRILLASVSTSLIHVVGTILFVKTMPKTYYIVGSVFQLFALLVIRLGYRFIILERAKVIRHTSPEENTLIIGNPQNAKKVIDYITHDKKNPLYPVCIIDDKIRSGILMDGVPVVRSNDLGSTIEKYKVRNVIIADPFIENKFRKRIEKESEERYLKLVDMSGYLSILGDEQNVAEQLMEIQAAPATVKDKRIIPFSPPDIGEAEIGEVVEALKSGWITTGPRTKLLERRLAAYIETGKTDIDTESEPERWSNRVVCLNSATAAEELNLRVLGVGPGDEIIVPAYTYTASASAVIHCGATVKFVDIQKDGDPVTHCPEMDYEKLEEAINERTKAVVVVDLGGIVADYEKVFEIVERKKSLFRAKESDGTPLGDLNSRIQKSIGRVAILSDCAHGLGASRVINGEKKYTGAIADFTSFSFHAVKNFTTAEGGASSWRPIDGVKNSEIYKFYQLLSLHGQNKDALAKTRAGAWEYDIIGPWYKCNMTDIMAAIGLRQLDRYKMLLERRTQIIKRYDAVCDELGLKHLTHHTENMDSSNHLYLVRIPGADVEKRNKIIEEMAKKGVSTNVHYKPLPMMTAYKDAGIENYSNTYDYYQNLFTLPLHTLLSDDDIDMICDSLRQVIKNAEKVG